MAGRGWLAGVLGAPAFALLPWALLLGFELPSRHLARHWDLAWTGFDVALAATLLAAAIAALRASPWLGSSGSPSWPGRCFSATPGSTS